MLMDPDPGMKASCTLYSTGYYNSATVCAIFGYSYTAGTLNELVGYFVKSYRYGFHNIIGSKGK